MLGPPGVHRVGAGTAVGPHQDHANLPCCSRRKEDSWPRPDPDVRSTEHQPGDHHTWTDEIAALKAGHPHVRDPILAALNLLLTDPNITDTDAKARAAMRGVRITAASINGARNLLAKRETAMPTEAPAPAPERPARRRERAPEPAVDAEALIKQVVGKLQAQGNAKAERLRDAMRKAMALLAGAIGDA
jgi:hypothetical protein